MGGGASKQPKEEKKNEAGEKEKSSVTPKATPDDTNAVIFRLLN
jgi:hypothetical protein